MKKNADQPAFGGYEYGDSGHALLDPVKVRVNGLTKREYFAGIAMRAICGNPDLQYAVEDIAYQSVKIADAVLNELEKPKSE